MFSILKKLFSVKTRHFIIRLLPKALRHFIIERYITNQINALENAKRNLGDKWITALAGWENVGLGATGNNSGAVISNFWRTVPEDDQGNSPQNYAGSSIIWDIQWLKTHIDRLLGGKGSILDFGCNAGRVLHVQLEAGYKGVGVEINPKAVELGKKTYPSLKKALFFVGEGSEVLPKVENKSVDLIYSCAVLRHVAPEKIDAVLAQFSRIDPKYILTMEDEASLGYRTFPHDYRTKFKALGWEEIGSEYAIDIKNNIHDGHGLGTVLRIYAR
jgi:SAM-dependent methyltransferase